MEKLIGEYSYIEIPEDAPKDNPVFIHLNKIWTDSRYLKTWWRKLPPGNYELIGISSEITEEQAAGIVEPLFTKQIINENGKYRAELDLKPMPFLNYLWNNEHDEGDQFSSKDTAKESFQSLLTSKGLKGRYAILKTIK